MLNMRLAQAPLSEEQNRTILTEYNRLTSGRIPLDEFMRWVGENPAGPAWHALLETDEGRIVGHTSLLPLQTGYRGARLAPAMSEYSFLHEEFRKGKIRGYEGLSRPPFVILLDKLFQHYLQQGFGPIFLSTNERNQLIGRKVGLRPTEFPLWECLLVLRPASAAQHTPNVSAKQRAALYTAGLAQSSLWSFARFLGGARNGVHLVPIGTEAIRPEEDRLSFYEEPESLRWRYPAEQYLLYKMESAPDDYVIAKHGSEDRFLRVCQYRLSSPASVASIVPALVEQAVRDSAMGVRWAVYDDESSQGIVRGLRRRGFLCARRIRIVMVHRNFPEFLSSTAWRMNDTHFSFDP